MAIESGVSWPSYPTAHAIARALGVKMEELYQQNDDEAADQAGSFASLRPEDSTLGTIARVYSEAS